MTRSTIIPTLPTTHAEAIAFALDHLEPFEAFEFLSDWREGRNLRPWIQATAIDRMASMGNWETHPAYCAN